MRTTTDAKNWRFTFGITDLGIMLGKAPVTLRGWERSGMFRINRDSKGDRRLTTSDIREIATTARSHNRIDEDRLNMVLATTTMLEMLERENIK